MQPAVPVQDVRRVSPAWLRPSAFGLVLCLHLVLLVVIPWPAGTNIPQPPSFEIQVIPRAEPARLLVPLDSAPAAEVKPASAVPVGVDAVEAQPLRHGQEIAEVPSASLFATHPAPGVLVSPGSEGAESKPRPPAAPVQAAPPAPASVETSALPVDPPSQGLLPSSEQRVAESEPLEALRPAVPAQVAQPVREAPTAEASALPANPPSQLPSSRQHLMESVPFEVRPPAASAQVAQPAPEVPSAAASDLAINPPSLPLSSGQHVAESEALEVRRPAAPIEGTRYPREGPSAEASALMINPSTRPLSPGQPLEDLAPFGVPQAATPVGVGPRAREVPVAASSTVASNSPTPGAVLSSGQQMAKVEPYSPIATPPLQDEGPMIPSRIGKIIRYVEQYDGGRCFFVAPVAVTETEAKLEGYAASARPFEALDSAFRHENGFEASIDVRLVTPAQCPAVTFLGRLRGANAPHLHIDGVNLGPGDALTGTVDGYGSRNIELLLATDAGAVQNVSHLLQPGTATTAFAISPRNIAKASGGQPQLLIVVASPVPLDALRLDGPVAADQLFSAALSEATRTNQPVAAMARYFKFER